jgi:Short C-terminal domain
MGLFGRNKQEKQNLTAEVARNLKVSQQLVDQKLAATGLDASSAAALAAAAGAMQPAEMQAAQAYGQRAARLFRSGVDTPATVRSIELGEHSPMLGGMPAEVGLTVEPPGGAPYAATAGQIMNASLSAMLAPGQRVTVKVDPADPLSVMVWAVDGAAPAPAAADSSTDRIGRLTRLQELRSTGALSEDEFQQQKAKLLAE